MTSIGTAKLVRVLVAAGLVLLGLSTCPGSKGPHQDVGWTAVGDGRGDQPALGELGATDSPLGDVPIHKSDGPQVKPPDSKPPAPPPDVTPPCANLGQPCTPSTCCGSLACSGAGNTCCKPVGQTCQNPAECCVGRACVLQKCCVIVGDGCSQDPQCCNYPAHQCLGGVCCVKTGNGCSQDYQCCSNQCSVGKCK